MKNPRLREVKYLVQGNIGKKGQKGIRVYSV